jgi:hypothetical protein
MIRIYKRKWEVQAAAENGGLFGKWVKNDKKDKLFLRRRPLSQEGEGGDPKKLFMSKITHPEYFKNRKIVKKKSILEK